MFQILKAVPIGKNLVLRYTTGKNKFGIKVLKDCSVVDTMMLGFDAENFKCLKSFSGDVSSFKDAREYAKSLL